MTPFTDKVMSLPRYASDGKVAINPGFDRIEALLAAMGNPNQRFEVALVAGTNGKGSTASLMAACLTSAGIKTGLHTSPHLLHVSERMKVDGRTPSPDWLERACKTYFSYFESVGASFFEASLALSLLWFADQKVTHAVIEVGLGGRLDATNVLSAKVSVITGVALDHTEILGDSIEKIAREKAGIIKRETPVVLGKMTSEAVQAIFEIAKVSDSPVIIANRHVVVHPLDNSRFRLVIDGYVVDNVLISLHGSHQLGNAITALCALRSWVPNMEDSSIQKGFSHVQSLTGLRGRAEVIQQDPIIMVDVAHNPDAIITALAAFDSLRSSRPSPVVIIGLLDDKDAAEIGRVLATAKIRVWTVPTQGARGLSAEQLSDKFEKVGVKDILVCDSTESALQRVQKSDFDCLVCGSHLVVAQAMAAT